MKRLIPLLFAALPVMVSAACPATIPSNVACVTWTAPATNTDTTPIAAAQLPLTFHVYRQVSPTAWQDIWVTPDTTAIIPGLALGQQCFAITAMDQKGAESLISISKCKTLRLPAPSDGSIEAPTDGSIEFPKP